MKSDVNCQLGVAIKVATGSYLGNLATLFGRSFFEILVTSTSTSVFCCGSFRNLMMAATSLVSRLALRGHGLGLGLGLVRPLHASAAVAGKHVWYPDIDTVSECNSLRMGQSL